MLSKWNTSYRERDQWAGAWWWTEWFSSWRWPGSVSEHPQTISHIPGLSDLSDNLITLRWKVSLPTEKLTILESISKVNVCSIHPNIYISSQHYIDFNFIPPINFFQTIKLSITSFDFPGRLKDHRIESNAICVDTLSQTMYLAFNLSPSHMRETLCILMASEMNQ